MIVVDQIIQLRAREIADFARDLDPLVLIGDEYGPWLIATRRRADTWPEVVCRIEADVPHGAQYARLLAAAVEMARLLSEISGGGR